MGRQDGPAGKDAVDLSVPVTHGKVVGEKWLPCPKLSLDLYTVPYPHPICACAGLFPGNLTQAGVILEEGVSTEGMPLPGGPMGKSVVHFPD